MSGMPEDDDVCLILTGLVEDLVGRVTFEDIKSSAHPRAQRHVLGVTQLLPSVSAVSFEHGSGLRTGSFEHRDDVQLSLESLRQSDAQRKCFFRGV